jgi:hypothetical protein
MNNRPDRRAFVVAVVMTILCIIVVVGFVLSQGGPPKHGVTYESRAPKD